MNINFKNFNNTQVFIENYRNFPNPNFLSNVFGNPHFLNYHTKVNCSYLAIEKSNKLLCYLPYSEDSNSFISHQGATYGGFIQIEHLSKDEIKLIYSKTINYLKNAGVNTLTVRFLPELFVDMNKNNLNVYLKSQMTNSFYEEEYYLELNTDIENISSTDFRRNHKRDIKNFANTKFEIIENSKTENIEIFYNLLEENLKKHNTSPTHKLNELKWLLNNLSSNFKLTLIKNSKFYLAGSVKISINELTDYIIYGSMNYQTNSKGALKFLYWHEAQDSFSNKKKFLTFGINNKHHEEKNVNLDTFKLGFGCKVANRGTYKITI